MRKYTYGTNIADFDAVRLALRDLLRCRSTASEIMKKAPAEKSISEISGL